MKQLIASVLPLDIIRKILALCVVCLLASFLGFMVETVWIALRHGYIDNRGMHMPMLLGYGLANLVIFFLFGTPDHPKIYFFSEYATGDTARHFLYIAQVFVFITVCESLFGNLIYHFCHVEWWNYNSIPLHIGQYTSIPTSMGFTACIYLYINEFFVPIYNHLSGIELERYSTIILLLCLFALTDCAYSLLFMYKHHTVNVLFHKELHLPEIISSVIFR